MKVSITSRIANLFGIMFLATRMIPRRPTALMVPAALAVFRPGSAAPFFRSFSAKGGAIKHIVMFDFADKTTAADIENVKESLLELPRQIDTMQSYELGEDLLLPSGQSHPAGRNRRIAWSCTFPDVQSFESYQAHAAHQDFLALLKPLVRPGSRAANQYVVDTKKRK